MNADIARREDEEWFNTFNESEQEMPRCAYCEDENMKRYKFWDDELGEEVEACYFCIYDWLKTMDLKELFGIIEEAVLPDTEVFCLEDFLISFIDDNFERIFEEAV